MLEPDEAIEALSTFEFAINSVAGVLLERQSITGDEIEAIVRSHLAGQAN
jgi:hypothetical protein